jgi:hypothetical protein
MPSLILTIPGKKSAHDGLFLLGVDRAAGLASPARRSGTQRMHQNTVCCRAVCMQDPVLILGSRGTLILSTQTGLFRPEKDARPPPAGTAINEQINKRRMPMDEREKYRAEIDAKLATFGETLEEIKTKQALRNETLPDVQLDGIVRKHQEVQSRARELKTSDAGAYEEKKVELDSLMDDIDKELRASLAYFK